MKLIFTSLIVVFTLLNINAQTDVENSKDYSTIGRLPNFFITKYLEEEFDSHSFFYDNKNHIREGRKFTIEYKHQNWADKDFKFPTRLQILRNYSNAIQKAGGRVLFERGNAEHGYYSFKTSSQQEIWVQVKVAIGGKSYKLFIIEEEKMRQDLEISAELIKNKLEVDGKIAIYGIYFATGKSTIEAASTPALEQIAEFLVNHPSINCWVVGHTDAEGSFAVNSQLSLDRAKAVKEALLTTYGVAEHRLFAEGVGPLAPVATNATEAGKSLNRRVELVRK